MINFNSELVAGTHRLIVAAQIVGRLSTRKLVRSGFFTLAAQGCGWRAAAL
jgi:hypothetical protein